ncbi:homoserine kinase [Candidatus Woesearchaeota archaeon]|nr:homoserine kinase [Candidatus Woesearchaeota archaeon]
MITKTDVQRILERYDLGKLVSGVEVFEKGQMNQVGGFHTDTGHYVVRVYKGHHGSVMYEVNLLKRLARHGFPCHMPIPNQDNKPLIRYKGKNAVVFDFIEGEHIRRPTLSQIMQIGHYLGEMHKIVKGYRPRGERFHPDMRYLRAKIERLKNQSERQSIPNKKLFFNLAAETLSDLHIARGLPKGAIHADLGVYNMLFRDDNLVAFLDFDGSYYGDLVEDVGWGIAMFCCTAAGLDFRKMRAFLNGYANNRKMTGLEKDNLYDAMRQETLKHATYRVRGALLGTRKYDCKNKATIKLMHMNSIPREKFRAKIK